MKVPLWEDGEIVGTVDVDWRFRAAREFRSGKPDTGDEAIAREREGR